ncbi:MAG: putative Ig domain-containing protein, partial [Dehalococcoidia bacterium]
MRLRAGRLARGLVSAVVVMAGLALLSGDALAAPPAIAPASLPGGQVGVAYSQTLSASGSTAPYTWTVSAGSLPAGLTLSTAGVISGSPTTPGTA